MATGYHFTEVKKIIIDSVECGAGTNFCEKTIVQLWEDPAEDKKSKMTTYKTLGFLNKFNQSKLMGKEAEVKIE